MMKFQNIYISMALLLLTLGGCDRAALEEPETGDQEMIYLDVSTRAAHTSGEESINKDTEDFEDRVHDLALLLFNSATGAKVAHYFKDNLGTGDFTKAFTVKIAEVGTYDFYFIANMPELQSTLEAITTRTAMNNLMNSARDMDATLYRNALITKGFPMSRVYLNQSITAGGPIFMPLPFKPVVNGSKEDCVKLIRVVAKLEVNLEGSGLGVKDIYFRNANRHFTLADPNPSGTTAYFNDNTTKVPLNKKDDNTYIYYMPEAVISSAQWSTMANHKPINYFTIETISGTTYDIPIISNGLTAATDYLAKATGNSPGYTPQYTIHRNDHYKYVIKNLDKVEIIYSVNPWEVINKAIYMGYGYNVEIEGSNVTVYNTIEACSPHHVRLVTKGSITFKDGTTQKDFTSLGPNASVSYELSGEPPVGYGPYLEVYYVDLVQPVYTFSN